MSFQGDNPLRPASMTMGSQQRGSSRREESFEMQNVSGVRLPPPRSASTSGNPPPLPVKSPLQRQSSRLDDNHTSSLDDVETGGSYSPRGPTASRRMDTKGSGSAGVYGAGGVAPPPPPPASSTPTKRSVKGGNAAVEKETSRFQGNKPLQYALWGNNLAYCAALVGFICGIFCILWEDATVYDCKIDGEFISVDFLYRDDGTCPTQYIRDDGSVVDVCCSLGRESQLKGSVKVGIGLLILSVVTLFMENCAYGYGLWQPADSIWGRFKISPWALIQLGMGAWACTSYCGCLAGAAYLTSGTIQSFSVFRGEVGDGGRAMAKKKAASMPADVRSAVERFVDFFYALWRLNPVSFYRRIYAEDKLSTYVWLFLYFAGNVIFFAVTLNEWYGAVDTMRDGLMDGTLRVDCPSPTCHVHRKAVKWGPFSYFAPWAKGCGALLNLNCTLLLLPVVKVILHRLHNWGESFAIHQHRYDLLRRLFAHPLTRYVPLQKNLEFHKLCAAVIFVLTTGHLIFHYANLVTAHAVTMRFFRLWEWNGTNYLTGAIATYSMIVIYTAATDRVRFSNYEIFFYAHRFFVVFFLSLFLHGKKFFYWTCGPVVLYIFERYLQRKRGKRPFLLIKVEWIPPVMALYFRPVFKEHLPFKEGQYLYLNCPYVSASEWHPFTISSATDDLERNPQRISLETGEEVMEVPRPKNLAPNAKWNKYCLVSQDWTKMDANEFLDKADTAFFDYISVHIKVFGLDDPVAKTWTRRFKEYLEMMSPGSRFPYYFSRRDPRGEIHMGRIFGPDGSTPILRVDGPHSAPAEHYVHYGTLMLIGAGIGLTPCVSILTSLVRYRWQKNFPPEIVHFYWIVRHNELDAFQWLVHQLSELSYELKKGRHSGQIEKKYYIECHIYVTGYDERESNDLQPLFKSSKKQSTLVNKAGTSAYVYPTFTPEELHNMLRKPTVSSREQIRQMKKSSAENRLQDVWVWNGRPHWDDIFSDVKEQRQHSEIGVCFCGAATIGADLRSMCEKYSNVDDDCLFSLHKENF